MNAGRGRPPLSDQVRRTDHASARVTNAERRKLDELRALRGLTDSNLIRALINEAYAKECAQTKGGP